MLKSNRADHPNFGMNPMDSKDFFNPFVADYLETS